jgi:mannose-6-phosphate isomerase-like protein (cupin superfamily)
MPPSLVRLREKFAEIQSHWMPRTAGELNGQAVKLVKFAGEFVWHHHEHEDELFLVVRAGSPCSSAPGTSR